MHVRKLPSGNWRVIVKVNSRRASATCPTKKEAVQRGAELTISLGGQPPEPVTASTVRELLDLHLAEHPYRPTTLADFQSARKHIPVAFEDRLVTSVTPVVIDHLYRELLDNKVTVHRVRKIHTLLSSAWKRARRWGWANTNPCRDALVPAEPYHEPASPSPADAKRFLAAADDISAQFGLFARCAAIVGSRRGETCALQWHDINFELSTLHVRRSVSYTKSAGLTVDTPKTGRKGVRVVAVPPALLERLKFWQIAQAEAALEAGLVVGPSGWLFTKDWMHPWHPSSATHLASAARTSAGLPVEFKLKQLRNFVATELFSAGRDARLISNRLGQTRPSTMSDRYAASIPVKDREAAAYLEGLLDD